jgi:hypothetical protein
MALEAELELQNRLEQQQRANEHMTAVIGTQLKTMESLIKTVSKEADNNRDTAERIAKRNAEVKYHSKISGSDKSWLIFGLTFVLCITLGVVGGITATRMGDHEKMQVIQTCTAQGGQWRSLGGQDDANKYDEVCVLPAKANG